MRIRSHRRERRHRSRRRRLALLAAVALSLTLLPHPAAVARQGEDPLRTLGADSPLCKQAVDAAARAHCRATGAIEHPYPLDHYRFDWHITTGVTHITENFLAVVQWVCSIVWMGSLYLLKGALLMFQWAFSLDLLGKSMSGARATLERLHDTTLGQPWLLAAIAVLGLWGIWHGLVQRQTTSTVAGLGIALAMMAAALVVIDRPAETVGALSRGANDVSLAFLSGASEGTISRPQLAVSHLSEQLFDTIVLRPWCALDFADVRWCLSRAPGDPLTRADRWLRYEPDTAQRNAEYNAVFSSGSYKPDDPKLQAQLADYRPTKADRPKVDMQGKSKTVTRAVLLGLVLIGQTGALVLVGWLAFRVLLQGMLTLVLLLLAPVMLLAPAFGDTGRDAFRRWAMRLFAAVCSKAVYALLLAIVLAVASMIAELDAAFPWAVLWLLEGVFWWGVIVKRKELLALGSPGERGDSIAGLYYRGKAAHAGAAAVAGFAGATVGRAVTSGRRGIDRLHDRVPQPSREPRRSDRGLAVARRTSTPVASVDRPANEARRTLARHAAAKRELRSLNRSLRGYDRRASRAAREGRPGAVEATPEERRLAAHRSQLRTDLMAPAALAAARRAVVADGRVTKTSKTRGPDSPNGDAEKSSGSSRTLGRERSTRDDHSQRRASRAKTSIARRLPIDATDPGTKAADVQPPSLGADPAVREQRADRLGERGEQKRPRADPKRRSGE